MNTFFSLPPRGDSSVRGCLVCERSARVASRSPDGASTDGTLAFTVDRYGRTETAELSGITNEGTYDIDFQPFGWTTRAADAPAVAVARVYTILRLAGDGGSDWLVVVLSPGSQRLAVVMSGTFSGDSASGTWSAYGYRAGGGTGRFVMRRHAN